MTAPTSWSSCRARGVRAGPGGPFYHLTSARGPSVEEALGSLSELLELSGFDVRAVEEAEMTPLEQVFNRRTVFYSSYLRAPKTFERARPARGDVGATGCREYMRMFLRELAAETGDLGFSRATVRSFDDFPLVALWVCAHWIDCRRDPSHWEGTRRGPSGGRR